jgi:hypothetical protein
MQLGIRFARLVVLLAAMAPFPAFGQPVDDEARTGALGGAMLALAGQIGIQTNPASSALVEGVALHVFASQGFGLEELRLASAGAAVSLRNLVAGMHARTFGFEDYRETWMATSAAGTIFPGTTRPMHLGARLTWYHVAIPGYGSRGALGLSAGALTELSPGLFAGVHAVNLNAPRYVQDEYLPRSLGIGLAYQPDPSAIFLVDVVKDVRFPLDVRVGIEIRPVPFGAFRLGSALEPRRVAAGIGLTSGAVTVDLAADRHPWLGWTPAAGVLVNL